jgi:hypothetical protein
MDRCRADVSQPGAELADGKRLAAQARLQAQIVTGKADILLRKLVGTFHLPLVPDGLPVDGQMQGTFEFPQTAEWIDALMVIRSGVISHGRSRMGSTSPRGVTSSWPRLCCHVFSARLADDQPPVKLVGTFHLPLVPDGLPVDGQMQRLAAQARLQAQIVTGKADILLRRGQ